MTLVLSRILGYVGVDDHLHGHRVGYIVWRLSEHLGFSMEQRISLMEAGLLHDIGVSSTIAHRLLTSEIDVPRAVEHCLTGEAVIRSISTFSHLAPLVRYHHQHWKSFDFDEISEEAALFSNLIFLSDRLDILMSRSSNWSREEQEKVLDRLVNLQDLMFAPKLIEALLSEAEDPQFWEGVRRADQIEGHLNEDVSCCRDTTIDFSEMEQIAHAFAHVVDAKSQLTNEHSQNTALVAHLLAIHAGYSEEHADKIRISALLHDIGKLRVPDEILDKPGALNAEERERIEQHSADSWNILSGIGGLEEIAAWSGMHHEKLNGTGYPRGISGDEIAHEAQVLAAADIFQALLQERPYRRSLTVDEVLGMMEWMVEAGEINGDLVALLKQEQEDFMGVARSPWGVWPNMV